MRWGALTLGVAAMAAGCGGEAPTTASDRTPSAQASAVAASTPPAAVVRAYLMAWHAEDVTAMDALSTPQMGEANALIRNAGPAVRHRFSDIRILQVRRIEARPELISSASRGYSQVARVLVEMGVRQRPIVTWTDGRHPWGFELVREVDSDPWRISDQGLG